MSNDSPDRPSDIGNEITELGSAISDLFVETIGDLESHLESHSNRRTELDPQRLRQLFENDVSDRAQNGDIAIVIRDMCKDVVAEALLTVGDEGVSATPQKQHATVVDEMSDMVVQDIITFGDEIASDVARAARLVENRDGVSVVDRIENQYSTDEIERRGKLIAKMMLRRCLNNAKLASYRLSDEVHGVGVYSRCLNSTSPITADITGCDSEPIDARLDAEKSIGEQFQSKANAHPSNDFDPLPNVPPFAYGSRAELIPIMNMATLAVSTDEAALEEDDLDTVYSEWNDHVNMTASQLRKWSKNPCSREASVDPESVIKRNLRLLEKDKDEWTQNDIDDAKRTTSFISRMTEMEGETTADGGSHGCPDDKSISLLNWARNPFDSLPDGPDEDADLDAVEEVTLSSNITAYNVVEELGYEEGEFVEIKEDAFEEAGLDEVEIDDEHDGEYDYRRYGYVVEKNTEDFNWEDPNKEDEGQTIEVDDGETVYVVATGATGTGAHLFYEGALKVANEDDVIGDIGDEKDPSEANLCSGDAEDFDSFETTTPDVEELDVVDDAPVISKSDVTGAPWPESWRESDKPARLIALDAWVSWNASFSGCKREMRGKVAGVNRFCADFKDSILGTTYWR